jgi:hypothetical protein
MVGKERNTEYGVTRKVTTVRALFVGQTVTFRILENAKDGCVL